MNKLLLLTLLCFLSIYCQSPTAQKGVTTASTTYDLVLQNGRIIDPATQTDVIGNVAIQADTIAAISQTSLQGKKTIDATNLVIAPGFIDLHSHTPTPLGQHFQLMDGVTTSLDLEAGAFPQSGYGAFLKEGALINYGASVGYFAIRIKVVEAYFCWWEAGS